MGISVLGRATRTRKFAVARTAWLDQNWELVLMDDLQKCRWQGWITMSRVVIWNVHGWSRPICFRKSQWDQESIFNSILHGFCGDMFKTDKSHLILSFSDMEGKWHKQKWYLQEWVSFRSGFLLCVSWSRQRVTDSSAVCVFRLYETAKHCLRSAANKYCLTSQEVSKYMFPYLNLFLKNRMSILRDLAVVSFIRQ